METQTSPNLYISLLAYQKKTKERRGLTDSAGFWISSTSNGAPAGQGEGCINVPALGQKAA